MATLHCGIAISQSRPAGFRHSLLQLTHVTNHLAADATLLSVGVANGEWRWTDWGFQIPSRSVSSWHPPTSRTSTPDHSRNMASRSREMADIEVGQSLLERPSSSSRSSEYESSRHPSCPSCSYKQAHKRPAYKTKTFWITYLNLLLFFTSIILFVKSKDFLTPASISPREALKATSNWSPVFDQVDLTPLTTEVDGRLHIPANASIYRGDPSDETDAAWEDLAAEAYEVILVNSGTLEKAGFNPSHYFQAPSSWGYGEGQFPVQIDVFHQIHCLNAIRKQMYYQHYYAPDFPNGPDEMHWMHQRHCLHMVMQSLTCNANVDIVPHRWVENDDIPFAQFGIERKCRNFDNLRAWNKQNAMKDVRKVWPHSKENMPKDAFVWPGFGGP